MIHSTTERPRTSWSQLLHGQQTIRLCAKLSNFILDVFSFTRPNMTILQYACRRCRASTRVFRSMLGTCLPDVGRRHAGRYRHGFRLSTACRHHVGFCAGRKPRSSEVNCSDLFNIIFRRHGGHQMLHRLQSSDQGPPHSDIWRCYMRPIRSLPSFHR